MKAPAKKDREIGKWRIGTTECAGGWDREEKQIPSDKSRNSRALSQEPVAIGLGTRALRWALVLAVRDNPYARLPRATSCARLPRATSCARLPRATCATGFGMTEKNGCAGDEENAASSRRTPKQPEQGQGKNEEQTHP